MASPASRETWDPRVTRESKDPLDPEEKMEPTECG